MSGGAGDNVARRLGALSVQLGRGLLDSLLPPRCLSCGEEVDRQGGLCPPCWGRLTFITPPCCQCCGLPFAVDLAPLALPDPVSSPGDETGLLCGGCTAKAPAYGRARAALVYDDGSRPLLLAFKHADRDHAASSFGPWMVRAGQTVLEKADLLIPVPLHRWRLFRRRYNQAALLARSVGQLAGIPAVPDLLLRKRATPTQGGLGRDARQRNVRGAFTVRRGGGARLQGRHVVLVDDVQTTGATIEECARVLLQAGAASVDILTLARVIMSVR